MKKHDIELIFYKLLRENLSVLEFEKWVYDIDEELIVKYFGRELYFELISLNYRNKYVIPELEKLLYSKIPFGRFYESKIKMILNSIIEDKRNLEELIGELYYLCCDGFLFLKYFYVNFIPPDMLTEYESYNFSKKNKIKIKSEAQRILHFINTKEIVITGEFEYKDFRKDEEKIQLKKLRII